MKTLELPSPVIVFLATFGAVAGAIIVYRLACNAADAIVPRMSAAERQAHAAAAPCGCKDGEQ